MKKAAIFLLTGCLMVAFFTITPPPARADDFWSGVAIGVGSAIILGTLLQHPPVYFRHEYRGGAYRYPDYGPPPAYRERWVPGYWVERYDANGNYERYWVPEHWERIH